MVNQVMHLGVVYTRSCQMLMHTEIENALHLLVNVVQNGEFSCYIVLGATNKLAYY